MKYPRYKVEKFKGGFIVTERCVRGFNYVYRNTGFGEFNSRETADAAKKSADASVRSRLIAVA